MAQEVIDYASSLLRFHHLSRQIGHLKGRIDQFDKTVHTVKTRPTATNAPAAKEIKKLHEDIEDAIDREFETKASVKQLEESLNQTDCALKQYAAHCVITQLKVEQLEQDHKRDVQIQDQKHQNHVENVENTLVALNGKLDDMQQKRIDDLKVINLIQNRLIQLNEENLELKAAVKDLSSRPQTQDAQIPEPYFLDEPTVPLPASQMTTTRPIQDTQPQISQPAAETHTPNTPPPRPRKRTRASQGKDVTKRRKLALKRPAHPQKSAPTPPPSRVQKSFGGEIVMQVGPQETTCQPSELEAGDTLSLNGGQVAKPAEEGIATQARPQEATGQPSQRKTSDTLSLRGRKVAKPYLASQQPRVRQKGNPASKMNKAAMKASQTANTECPLLPTIAASPGVPDSTTGNVASQTANTERPLLPTIAAPPVVPDIATRNAASPTKSPHPAQRNGSEKPMAKSNNDTGVKFNIIRRSRRVYGRTRHQAPAIIPPHPVDSSSATESNISVGEQWRATNLIGLDKAA